MSVPDNIDVFNRIVATCMLQLYEAFPVPQDINPSSVAMQAIQEHRPDGEMFDILSRQAAAAIKFLAAEGFIRFRSEYRTLDAHTFPKAQLTLKGLAVLGAVPDTVDVSRDRRTLAEQLRDGMQIGAEETLSTSVSSMLSAALGMGLRAVVSAATRTP